MPEKYWILAIGGAIALIGIGSNVKFGNVAVEGVGKKAGAIAGAFGGLIALVGLVYALWPQWIGLPSEPRSTVTVTEPAVTSPTPIGGSLKFVPLASKKVPRCSSYSGVGPIPGGYQLLIFERAVGEAVQDIGEKYGYNGHAIRNETGDAWRTVRMDHGADHVEVTAVLVPQAFDDFFENLRLVDNQGKPLEGGWQIDILPPGEKLAPVFPDPDLSAAPCTE